MNVLIANKLGELVGLFSLLEDGSPEYYKMQEGDKLVEDVSALEMINPYWTGKKWIEKATAEEIEEAKFSLAPTIDPVKTLEDTVARNQLATDLAIAELYEMLIG